MARPAYICPICFATYQSVIPEWPVCPDCDGEGIGVDVISLKTFLSRLSLDELYDCLEQCRQATSLRERYRAAKERRIERVIGWKQDGR